MQQFMDLQNPDDRDFFSTGKSGHSQKVHLIRDVPTRWGSSYDMVKRAWELKKTIRRWLKADGQEKLKNLFTANGRRLRTLFAFLHHLKY